MGFWGAYLSALLHYWWALVVVGAGGFIQYLWPFLPASVHQLPPEMGWAIAYGGIILAQVLAARRVFLSTGSSNATVGPPPAEAEVHFDDASLSQTTGAPILYARHVEQHNTFIVSPPNPVVSFPNPAANIGSPGLVEPANDDEPDEPADPAEPPAPGA